MSPLTLLSVALLALATPSEHVAFVSGTEQEDLCVCVIDVATGDVARVGSGVRDGAPAWSPDGNRIAYTTAKDGGLRVRIVDADGSNPAGPEHANEWNRQPVWSPDGTRIAYTAGEPPAEHIVVYDVATKAEARWGGELAGLSSPAWVGNDQVVAIGRIPRKGGIATELFSVTSDEATALLPDRSAAGSYVEWAPRPHPSGMGLAYESNDGGDREIFVLLFARRIVIDVSNHHAADWNPVWSPDGKRIAFESFRSGRRGIFSVDPERLLVTPVMADTVGDHWAPTYSPNGEAMAFVSNRTGDPELFVVDLAGGDVRQLTDHAGPDLAPAWRPERSK
ncbi:MAG: hypothetical protein GY851_07785 [bacterium]|nr:hypothetical protein [bacterium]